MGDVAVDLAALDALLTQSRSAHELAKDARRQKRPHARDLLIQARDLRVQAHALDPEHTAELWGQERTPHAQYMAFYVQQLGEA